MSVSLHVGQFLGIVSCKCSYIKLHFLCRFCVLVFALFNISHVFYSTQNYTNFFYLLFSSYSLIWIISTVVSLFSIIIQKKTNFPQIKNNLPSLIFLIIFLIWNLTMFLYEIIHLNIYNGKFIGNTVSLIIDTIYVDCLIFQLEVIWNHRKNIEKRFWVFDQIQSYEISTKWGEEIEAYFSITILSNVLLIFVQLVFIACYFLKVADKDFNRAFAISVFWIVFPSARLIFIAYWTEALIQQVCKNVDI